MSGKLGIALAPLAWLLLMAVCASLLGFALLQILGDLLPLHKTVSKLTLILLLLSVFPLRKKLQLSWADLGFAPVRQFSPQLAKGLALALVTLLPVLLLLYALDVQVWDDGQVWTAGKLGKKIALALFTSLLIGVGEELLFRGLLLSALRRHLAVPAAIGLSSFYYAALHFLKSKTVIPYPQQSWHSGFELMAEAFANWLNPEIFTAFLALLVVGSFLALLRTYLPHSLGLCIGCHAGWVWQIKLGKDFCNLDSGAAYAYLVNAHYDGIIGPLVALWLAFAAVVWMAWRRKAGGGVS